MGKYLSEFQTTSAYTEAESELILPHVSLINDVYEVKYNQYDPYMGHEFVEIGGLKWATMNVGATAVTDNGMYFQWGDSSGYTAAQVGGGEGQKYFDTSWSDYKYLSGAGTSSSAFTKYNSNKKIILDAEDDGVAVNWGSKWRMPTTAEFAALGKAVNTAWTSDYKSTGVKGMICTAKDGSGAELFFPAAGYGNDGIINYDGSSGFYWSSSLNYFSSAQKAYYLYFSSGYVGWQSEDNRSRGRSLRGVFG